MHVNVIGAGLAGCEATYQLLKQGISVTLFEMKPHQYSKAHHSPLFAELVCSNSLRSDRLENAVGLLKEEMRRLDSLIMKAADHAKVPAGGALAVDRDMFSTFITDFLTNHPLCTVSKEEVCDLPSSPTIIATGPLTSEKLGEKIASLPSLSTLSFYDAAAPIVYKDSLNFDKVFRASRYERGDDYLNCPLTEAEYFTFIDALVNANTAPIHGFEEKAVFEGCMPIESMAKRGQMSPAFGPMKPVGLMDKRTEEQPFAVLQLRQDDAGDTLYNLVGFQTRLTFPEQKRVFGLIPGLENATYARYGVMHRNTFLHSPDFLNEHYQCIANKDLFFAGQITGVEGYVESASSGLLAGLQMAQHVKEAPFHAFTDHTAIGSLAHYISKKNSNFQPMNANFGLIAPLKERIRNKKQKYQKVAERALAEIDSFCATL